MSWDLLNSKVMFIALLIICNLLLLCFVLFITKKTSSKIYLIDFVCYKPPTSQKASKELVMKQAIQSGYFSEQILDFMKKTLERSGLGDSTYLAGIFFDQKYHLSMKSARREVEMTVFGAVDMLLAKTGVICEDIGILIVNCCIYNTMPSLSSIVVNKYKFRENILQSYRDGMQCRTSRNRTC
ncbi:hypothetical protein L1987_34853 [Smallanthus sonchifolius]|uniref:Uncharacterized protein n=1 Tax=Smallanthus sonchifolius TaxID=185202 RepID=A0ACB9HUE4_9ASTR|nr:hypothetical protein L1987_34853 [Smallanthus sonchifolius]